MASVEAFSGHITHYQLRDALVRRWAGEKGGRTDLGKVADRIGVHRNTVDNHFKTMRRWLDSRYKQAMAQADALLRGIEGYFAKNPPLARVRSTS